MDVEKLNHKFDIDVLQDECTHLLHTVGLHKFHNQISLKHTEQDLGSPWYQGAGSLKYIFGEDGGLDSNGNPIEHEVKLKQEDFTVLNEALNNTYIKQVYNKIAEHYTIGRFRLMALPHKKCMSVHTDSSKRIHIPIVTNENCWMIIDKVVHYLKADGSAYLTDTTKPHTALNANHKFLRLHLLFDLI
jgi:hypothetical protein